MNVHDWMRRIIFKKKKLFFGFLVCLVAGLCLCCIACFGRGGGRGLYVIFLVLCQYGHLLIGSWESVKNSNSVDMRWNGYIFISGCQPDFGRVFTIYSIKYVINNIITYFGIFQWRLQAVVWGTPFLRPMVRAMHKGPMKTAKRPTTTSSRGPMGRKNGRRSHSHCASPRPG